jgi:hypothetical protein
MVAMRQLMAAGTDAFLDDPNADFPDRALGFYRWIIDPPRDYPPFEFWEDKGWIPRDFGREVCRDFVMFERNRTRYRKPELSDEEIMEGRSYVFPHLVRISRGGSTEYPDSDRRRAWCCSKMTFRGTIQSLRGWLWVAGLTPPYAPTVEALNTLMTERFANTPESDFPEVLLQDAAQMLLYDHAVELLEKELRVPPDTHLRAVKAFALLMRARSRYFYPDRDVNWGSEYVRPDGKINPNSLLPMT